MENSSRGKRCNPTPELVTKPVDCGGIAWGRRSPRDVAGARALAAVGSVRSDAHVSTFSILVDAHVSTGLAAPGAGMEGYGRAVYVTTTSFEKKTGQLPSLTIRVTVDRRLGLGLQLTERELPVTP